MVVKDGMSVILAGVALGLVMAIAAAQILRHLLYGSGSTDVMIYLAAALVECWVPALSPVRFPRIARRRSSHSRRCGLTASMAPSTPSRR